MNSQVAEHVSFLVGILGVVILILFAFVLEWGYSIAIFSGVFCWLAASCIASAGEGK